MILEHEPVDVCIVGAGAAGGLLARLLTDAGVHVVLIDAGPYYSDPKTMFHEDEIADRRIWWPEDMYVQTGTAPRGLNSGLGVGGGTLVWTGATFRLFPDDFRVLSVDGQQPGASVADWPIGYANLAPYYDMVERHIGVAGAFTPWDQPDRPPYPQPPHGYYGHTVAIRRGFERLGLRTAPGPTAVLSRAKPRRAACCGCGFCMHGCRTGSMYSTAVAEVPPALETGRLDLRPECVGRRISTSEDGTTAEAVEYVHKDGQVHLQPARVVIASCHTVEIPRLLLASASAKHPNGLANSSDQLGRNMMSHPSAHAIGTFPESVNPWEGYALNHMCCLDFAQTQPGKPYVRGFTMETSAPLPAGAATGSLARLWGAELKRAMRQYSHMAGFFTICEGLPMPTNRVTIDREDLDRFGLPRAHLHYDWHTNDVRLMDAAQEKSVEVLKAAGATEVFRQPSVQVHPLGTARMGSDPASSVVDANGASHDVPNLYLAGGALFPTGSSVNPTLTILALAWRTAEHVAARFGRRILSPEEMEQLDS
ncbi:MAG TPA: GMC family oxidoreductase [Chloroflexota bacterium]|nr:GMC family oxidoreductase [Chloroflexota bacterium]